MFAKSRGLIATSYDGIHMHLHISIQSEVIGGLRSPGEPQMSHCAFCNLGKHKCDTTCEYGAEYFKTASKH